MIPALSERSLVTAEIGYDSRRRVISAHLRFDPEHFTDRPRARVTFWCARAGALLRAPRETSNLRTDVVLPGVVPAHFATAVDRICSATGHSVALSPSLAPFLIVDMGGPATIGISYDAGRRRLFVPCPVAPPAGDALVLEVVLPPPARQRVRAMVRVDEVRTRAGASPGRPAGFALGIEEEFAHAALAAAVPAPAALDGRAAPRTRTTAPVRVELSPAAKTVAAKGRGASAACLRDLSHQGAFIRTGRPAPVGTQVRISVRLPDGRPFETIATVARVARDGMGVEFLADAYGESRLAAALAPLAGRPQRVLIIDDDALARAILKDAFENRGFEVLTAPDAELGLHVLADEILTLDALVTDVRMPGVDGEELVRRIRGAGGEHDLPIVAATATLDEALANALQAAGADRAIEKSLGPELVVDATAAAISSRRACLDEPVDISAA
jgi:CheY-like chemotaxis protein